MWALSAGHDLFVTHDSGQSWRKIQLLGLPAIIDEDVPHARDRRREEDSPPVDRLAEPRDLLTSHDLLELAVFGVGDEQASRVRAEVDGGDAHALTLLWRTRDPRETRWCQTPGRNQSSRRIV